MKRSALSGWVGLFVLSIALPSFADDWPQWRGPPNEKPAVTMRRDQESPAVPPSEAWAVTWGTNTPPRHAKDSRPRSSPNATARDAASSWVPSIRPTDPPARAVIPHAAR
jgi:hypothetical protein